MLAIKVVKGGRLASNGHVGGRVGDLL